jgi:hypothetical protein
MKTSPVRSCSSAQSVRGAHPQDSPSRLLKHRASGLETCLWSAPDCCHITRSSASMLLVSALSELQVLEAALHFGFLDMAPEDAEIAPEIRRFIDEQCPKTTEAHTT